MIHDNFTPWEIELYARHRRFGLKRTGNELRGPCPIHRGNGPNFALNRETGVWYCHSQCGRGGSLIDLEMLTQEMDFLPARASLFGIIGRPKPNGEANDLNDLLETYDYVDESGVLLFQCVRFYPKQFRQRRPDGNGGFDWGITNVRRVLYRLPRLKNAQQILLVEGERDVHALERLGFVATCNPGGTGMGWREEYSVTLRDKDVIHLPDQDEPGRKFAEKIGESLRGHVRSYSCIAVARGKDVSDWIRLGATRETLLRAIGAATPVVEEEIIPEVDWHDLLILGKKGRPLAVLANAIIALTHTPEWRKLLAYNEFTFETTTRRETPWGKPAGSPWTDIDDTRTAVWLQHSEILCNTKVVAEAVHAVARDNPFNPLRDQIKALKWDNTPRLDTWLIVYLGAADAPYVRAVGARWMISLMARLWRPGCKADHVLMLEGPQGQKKSSALALLVGQQYFADRVSDVGSKDAMMEMAGKWVIEMSELPNLRGAVLDRFKAFLSSQVDRFRNPYGRYVSEHPRQCVLAASTNSTEPFIDPTGTRRIWPVSCGTIDLESLAADREQLLAEANYRFQQGEPWWLETADLEKLATEEQDGRYEPGVFDDFILAWIQNPIQSFSVDGLNHVLIEPWDGSELGKVTTNDILLHAVGKDKNKLTQADYKQVARCLERIKWKCKQDRSGGPFRGKRYYYSPERVQSKQW